MSIFLLPEVVHTKEGKEEERLWRLVACGWARGEGRTFICGSILWIALGLGLVVCGLWNVFRVMHACGVGVFKVCGLQRMEGICDLWLMD